MEKDDALCLFETSVKETVTFAHIIWRFTPSHIFEEGVVTSHNANRGGVGVAHFNMATRAVAGGKATVNSVRIGILFENKVHLKLFIEGCKVAPRRISG